MGSLIDFTNPAAKRWWQDQVRQAIQEGADGFKDDDAEGNFLGPVKFADGTDVRVMRNRYAVLYNNAMEELIARAGSSLKISGDAATHMMVRWRFGGVKSVTVNGTAVKLLGRDGFAFVEFDHVKESLIKWE